MFKGKNSSVSKYGTVNIKLLLLLTEEQQSLINKYFGHSRFAYNKCLDYNKELYEKEKRSLDFCHLVKWIADLKKGEKTSFLSEVDATSLQQAVQDYCNAREKFLKKRGGYPKYRSKRHKETFRLVNQMKVGKPEYDSVRLSGNKLKLGKFGWVITKPCQTIPNGSIQSVTVKRTKTGKVFATLTIRRDQPIKELAKTGKEAGFDLGMKNFSVSSDGVVIPVPEFVSVDANKIARLHRLVSRKQKGSNNREKAIKQLSIAYEKDSNRRNDFLNKLSLSIVKEYDFIAMEHLDIQSMLKDNKKLKKFLSKKKNKKVCELGWYTFMQMVEYKAKWYGKEFAQVDKYYPSSQTCSHCGFINKDIKDESIREWTCPCCNTKHDRDRNAAINILREGKRIINEKE